METRRIARFGSTVSLWNRALPAAPAAQFSLTVVPRAGVFPVPVPSSTPAGLTFPAEKRCVLASSCVCLCVCVTFHCQENACEHWLHRKCALRPLLLSFVLELVSFLSVLFPPWFGIGEGLLFDEPMLLQKLSGRKA